jgi:putative transposase
LDLARSTCYYRPAEESAENLRIMRRIDEQHLRTPFYGSRNMTTFLRKDGEVVNRKRVRRLMRLMGIEAMYPRPRTTWRNTEHRVFPYLLRGVEIVRPNQVWSTDITYVPMPRGFMYLTAVIDWFSRYVLAWALSNTLEGTFCVETLDEALGRGTPDIFNTVTVRAGRSC